MVAYIKYLYSHWGVIQLTKINKAIIGFELYALMMIAMSFAGTNKLFASDDLFLKKHIFHAKHIMCLSYQQFS